MRAVADGGVGPHHGHAIAAVGPALVRIAVMGGDRELARRLVTQPCAVEQRRVGR